VPLGNLPGRPLPADASGVLPAETVGEAAGCEEVVIGCRPKGPVSAETSHAASSTLATTRRASLNPNVREVFFTAVKKRTDLPFISLSMI
jgi:hypothetical protein